MSEDVTPIRQQYLQIKHQYPDAIVFFRLGDFYETFDHDAEITSRELDIVLTSRNVAKGSRIPMAGIPYHAVENYLARLIEKGYHVAICEQVGDQPNKGIFTREVVRVVTPGTLIEPGLLHAERNNYLAAVILLEDKAGLAFADITTGEFFATELAGEGHLSQVRAELMRLRPAEVLLPQDTTLPNGDAFHVTSLPAWHFEPGRCSEEIKAHFKVATLDGFGLKGMNMAVRAAGAILQYLQDTQPQALPLLTGISSYNLHEFMTLDSSTRYNLELEQTIRTGDVHGSLLGVLDHTITMMGKRLMRQWVSKPLLDISLINLRLDCVEYLTQNGLFRAEVRSALKSIHDLERLTNRVVSGNALPRDVTSLRDSLESLQNFIQTIEPARESPLLHLIQQVNNHKEELSLLQTAVSEDSPATLQNTGIIRSGYSEELDNIITASQHARQWIANLEHVERERTGIKTLKVGFNKVFGYYIEISRGQANQAPSDYIRKQTLVNGERFITPEMKEYESVVLNAEERIHDLEIRLFREICTILAKYSSQLLQTSRALAEIDVLASLAEVSVLNGYNRPELIEENTLEIIDGRHPVVELGLEGTRFIPNDAVFEPGEVVRIITGPNMSGKSTFLRQTALIVLMAQMGCFVPARQARIGLVDRIFTRIGAQDEIHSGQSTFMVEMVETANILHHATESSLLILDEIGRGTSTYDGVSIAWAVIEYIHNHPRLRSRTLFATHYHELTQLADLLPGIRNYNVAVSEADGQVVFLHRIVPGGADRSYGIHVAQLAGLPKPAIQRASEILRQLESSSGKARQQAPDLSQQLVLFPETNPLLDELKDLDMNAITPIEALNLLYEWQKKYLKD
ncbi:MAG TPA: DNA mismatch repair protein MutS [Anaerolineaceae bacterium]|nr:DNA mismatch repair protein MutS [Anaerolineaceae bacterium]